jgi:hypothetical protein
VAGVSPVALPRGQLSKFHANRQRYRAGRGAAG